MSNKRGYSGAKSEGVDAAIKDLRQFVRKLETVPQEELAISAGIIKSRAIDIVPYDTGKLEKSIYAKVSKDKRRPGLFVGARAYSKKGYDYAGIQHDTEYPIFVHANGRQYHYIVEPFEDEVAQLKERLRDRLKVVE